jgi:hypothetical protein
MTHPMSKKSLWPRFLLTLSWAISYPSAFALGMQVPYETFATSNAVDQVLVCGNWPAPKEQHQVPRHYDGIYRIVHASQNGQSFLYVQWMQYVENGDRIVHHTTGNDHSDIELSQITCAANIHGIQIKAFASSGHDAKLRSISIRVGKELGKYKLQMNTSQ